MLRKHYNSGDIKQNILPYDFYLREQDLYQFKNRSGEWLEAGLCPFHNDRSSGSFFINLQTGAYKCFSCDAKGSDIISFVMQKYEHSFKEALEWLQTWRI